MDFHGEVYDVPLTGDGTSGLGIPLKMMVRPLRADIPVYLAAIGPKNVALAAEIADGWLPIFVSPERFRKVFPLEGAPKGFDIAAGVNVVLTKDREGGREYVKHHLALYVGGMGAARTSTTTSSAATATRRTRRASRISISKARSSRRRRPCRTRSSTRWRSSARATRSPTGSTRGVSAA